MSDKPEIASNAKWQLEVWFSESLGSETGPKPRDSLRAYFLVGEPDHATELLKEACNETGTEYVSFITVDLSHVNLTPQNLHKYLGIRSPKYHKAKLSRVRKCVLFTGLDQTTKDFRDAIVGLAKNRRCGPMYFPANWMAYINVPTEESIVDLLTTKMILDAHWIEVTEGTDVGSIDAQELTNIHINKTEDAGRHYGPRNKKRLLSKSQKQRTKLYESGGFYIPPGDRDYQRHDNRSLNEKDPSNKPGGFEENYYG